MEVFRMKKNKNLRNYGILPAVIAGIILLIPGVFAADPGHGAGVIGSGTFESGNFVFPSNLDIYGNLSIANAVFFVNNFTARIGIGTRLPTNTLNVIGGANITTNLSVGNAVLVNAT